MGKELRYWKVIPESKEPITDTDLYNLKEIYTGRSRFWVALKEDGVIGTVGVKELDREKAKISRMFVLDEYHGKGIGQMLLNEALEFARVQGYKELVLNSHPLLTRSHRFYEKNGFILEGKDGDRFHFRLIL